MKKIYKKPLIMVEELTLDHAIAANCNADKYMMESLVYDFGYFNVERNCSVKLYEYSGYEGLWQDTDMDGTGDSPALGADGICYHSAVQIAFYS